MNYIDNITKRAEDIRRLKRDYMLNPAELEGIYLDETDIEVPMPKPPAKVKQLVKIKIRLTISNTPRSSIHINYVLEIR